MVSDLHGATASAPVPLPATVRSPCSASVTKCRISRHFGVTFARGVFQPHLTGATGVSPPHVTNGTTRRAHRASWMGFAASRPRSGPSPHPTSAAAAAAEPSGAAQPAGRAAGDVLDGVEGCRWSPCADMRRLSPRHRPAERQRPRSRPARARRSGCGRGGVGWGAGAEGRGAGRVPSQSPWPTGPSRP